MPISGADIPQELFEHILWYIEIHKNSYGVSKRSHEFAQVLAASKRTIGSCALVSRYWAKVCRPRLFNNILLQTFEDLWGCIAVIDGSRSTELPAVSMYVHSIRCQPKPGGRPWIHLVQTQLRRRLPRFTTIDLDLDDAYFYPGLTTRTIQQGLPRAIPRMYACLKVLILRDIHFENGPECVQLLAELPFLVGLTLERVTWKETPDLSSFARVHNRMSYLRVVERGCALFTWLLSARLSHHWWEPRRSAQHTTQLSLVWDTSEQAIIADLCRAFELSDSSQASVASPIPGDKRELVDTQHTDDHPLRWSAFYTAPDIDDFDDSSSVGNCAYRYIHLP